MEAPGPAEVHSWLPVGGTPTASGVGPPEKDGNSLWEWVEALGPALGDERSSHMGPSSQPEVPFAPLASQHGVPATQMEVLFGGRGEWGSHHPRCPVSRGQGLPHPLGNGALQG